MRLRAGRGCLTGHAGGTATTANEMAVSSAGFELAAQRLAGRDPFSPIQATSGDERQVQRRPDSGRGRNDRRNGIDDSPGGAGDRGLIVVAVAATRDDVHRVRRLTGDLDAIGTAAGGGLLPVRSQVGSQSGDVLDDDRRMSGTIPRISNCSAASVPLATWPTAMSKSSGAGSRWKASVISSTSMPRPAASWRMAVPQAMLSTPGCSSIGVSSSDRPKPM